MSPVALSHESCNFVFTWSVVFNNIMIKTTKEQKHRNALLQHVNTPERPLPVSRFKESLKDSEGGPYSMYSNGELTFYLLVDGHIQALGIRPCHGKVPLSEILSGGRNKSKHNVMGVDIETTNNDNIGKEIDPAFVQNEEHRPKPQVARHDSCVGDQIPGIDLSALRINPAADQIPVIDLSPSQIDPPDEKSLESLVYQVGKACQDWGFFQVVNHGLPLHLLRNLESAANDFFSLPLEEKRKIRRNAANPLGYFDTELTKNVRDWKEVFDFVLRDTLQLPAEFEGDSDEIVTFSNQWPQSPPGFREACQSYAVAAEKLSFRLLELISRSLGLPATRLNGYFEDNMSAVRLNCYPPCPAPHLALGVGRHKDGAALTVLYQDGVGGLEVRRKDGEWIGVEPVADSFVINVGDCVQVWSNDKYESVEHRVVVNNVKRRLSIPFFFGPSHHVMVKPVEELLSEDRPAKYREYNWGKFSRRRRDSNFKNLGVENLQISHYKISP